MIGCLGGAEAGLVRKPSGLLDLLAVKVKDFPLEGIFVHAGSWTSSLTSAEVRVSSITHLCPASTAGTYTEEKALDCVVICVSFCQLSVRPCSSIDGGPDPSANAQHSKSRNTNCFFVTDIGMSKRGPLLLAAHDQSAAEGVRS